MKTSIRKVAGTLSVVTALGVVTLFGTSGASAQQKAAISKQQLMGTWTLVSVEVINKAGVKEPLLEGTDPKGLLMFDPSRFSFQVISEHPKLASADRLKTTPEENKAVAHGVLSYFGTYSLNEANGELMLKVDRSSFSNQSGTELKRVITFLSADELRYSVPARTAGGRNAYVWKRAR
jgi:lipocalin-like protein